MLTHQTIGPLDREGAVFNLSNLSACVSRMAPPQQTENGWPTFAPAGYARREIAQFILRALLLRARAFGICEALCSSRRSPPPRRENRRETRSHCPPRGIPGATPLGAL